MSYVRDYASHPGGRRHLNWLGWTFWAVLGKRQPLSHCCYHRFSRFSGSQQKEILRERQKFKFDYLPGLVGMERYYTESWARSIVYAG